MCGGYVCSKYSLAILNGLYMIVAFILIGVAAYAKAAAVITSISIAGGIIACGVFLLIIAIIGLVGALKHHQVLLFFYMVVLSLLFIIQFSIACACLALNKDQQMKLLKAGWGSASDEIKSNVQFAFNCCGFNTFEENGTASNPEMGHPSCDSCCPKGVRGCCANDNEKGCNCSLCADVLEDRIGVGLRAAGGVGLFFAFTEMLGVIFAFVIRRNHKEEIDKNIDPPQLQSDTSSNDPQYTYDM